MSFHMQQNAVMTIERKSPIKISGVADLSQYCRFSTSIMQIHLMAPTTYGAMSPHVVGQPFLLTERELPHVLDTIAFAMSKLDHRT